MLLKGTAVIRTNLKAVITRIGPGEVCGEMAYLEAAEASVTVIAKEEIEAVAIQWSVLDNLFELYPHLASRFYRSLAVTLSRRLRREIGF